MNSDRTKGLIGAELNNINTLILEWGEAAGSFLSLEPLMRYIAENHQPMRDKVAKLLSSDKSTKNKEYIHYWDCNPKYLVGAIESEFRANLPHEALQQILKFSDIRDKFLHGNFIGLMVIMGIEPSGRFQVGQGKWKRLESGEIYESFLSMKKNEVFEKLRRYSSDVRQSLESIIRSLAT